MLFYCLHFYFGRREYPRSRKRLRPDSHLTLTRKPQTSSNSANFTCVVVVVIVAAHFTCVFTHAARALADLSLLYGVGEPRVISLLWN